MRLMKSTALAICLACPTVLFADNILVFGGDPNYRAITQSNLEALGHTVTNQAGLPADLSIFDTIWHASLTAISADEITALHSFVESGGGVHLTGERPPFDAGLNVAAEQLINSVVSGGGVVVGGQGDIVGPYVINPAAVEGLASNPNTITTWAPLAPGGMGGVGGLPDPNILVTGAGDVPVGAAWTDGDMVAGSGRITVLMDWNWLANTAGDNIAFIENIQVFLAGGEVDTGTARFKVTKEFTDLSEEMVEVTLTCNGGLPLSQSFMIAGGDEDGVTFVVTNLPDGGATCEVTESGGPDNYTPSFNSGDGCEWSGVVAGFRSCVITNTPDDATYTVALDWVLGDAGAEEPSYEVPVTITCDTEILSVDMAPDSQTTNQVVVTLDDGDDVTVTVDTELGDTACSASQSPTQSGVEAEASAACSGADLSAGGSATCTFTNTVFFEGIPTLSQYGLALLALLMLGVGFVGMRRFV